VANGGACHTVGPHHPGLYLLGRWLPALHLRPRGLHYEGVYQLEDSVPAEIVEGLKELGHKTTSVVGPLGSGQAIWIDWDKGSLTGGSDPRKDGCTLGY
jgi:gamma-glutamyltranspeptidase